MDDIVKQALRKWPNVPACWGWLGLDMRGNWWLRDAQAQARGPFAVSKGDMLMHDKLREFIGRNYEADAQGQWFFQNGPQRVYVELESTPMVWRVDGAGQASAHTGTAVQHVQQCVVDEAGHAYLQCDGVLGLVHSQDMVHLEQFLANQHLQCVEHLASQLPALFGFVRSPQQAQVST